MILKGLFSKSQKGVSLVELILVVMVVGLTIVLLANLPGAIKIIGLSRRDSLANDILTKQVENLRLQGYDNIASNGSYAFIDPRFSSFNSSSGLMVVEDCPSSVCISGETKIKQVTLSMKWKENGVDKTVKLITLISQGGIK